jgi:predicted nucleotidyltransferase
MIGKVPKRVGNLGQKYRTIVGEMVEELKRRSEIKAIVLSGSVARGDITPYSDIELNVIVKKESEEKFEDEDLWRSRNVYGVSVEICYASAKSWEKKITSQGEEPRCLNQFVEAKILHDSNGAAKRLVNFAKKDYAQLTYPPRCLKLAEYAVKHNRNKILSDSYRGKELAAAMDADFAIGWILRGLAYKLNIPNTEWSRNLGRILASKHLTDEFKETLTLAIKGGLKQRIKAAIHLSDLYLQITPS